MSIVQLPCPHANKAFGRVIFRDGSTHVEERCPDCGANVRGGGIRVPHEEAGDVALLPVIRDYRDQHKPAPVPGLFDGLL